jgi:hypothetical protein
MDFKNFMKNEEADSFQTLISSDMGKKIFQKINRADNDTWKIFADFAEDMGIDINLVRANPAFYYKSTIFRIQGHPPTRTLPEIEKSERYKEEENEKDISMEDLANILFADRYWYWQLHLSPQLVLMRSTPYHENALAGYTSWGTEQFIPVKPMNESEQKIIKELVTILTV